MKERKLFGVGAERMVYEDPRDPNRLIKESLPEAEVDETVRKVKARYFLTKLLHHLLPEHVPNIYRVSATIPKTVIVEKKHLDENHAFLRQVNLDDLRDIPGDLDEFRRHKRLLEEQIQRSGLRKKLAEVLEHPDMTYINFGVDQKTGYVVYVDSFVPWRKSAQGVIARDYNVEHIQFLIAKLPEKE